MAALAKTLHLRAVDLLRAPAGELFFWRRYGEKMEAAELMIQEAKTDGR
jgi:hypothetical protein